MAWDDVLFDPRQGPAGLLRAALQCSASAGDNPPLAELKLLRKGRKDEEHVAAGEGQTR